VAGGDHDDRSDLDAPDDASGQSTDTWTVGGEDDPYAQVAGPADEPAQGPGDDPHSIF